MNVAEAVNQVEATGSAFRLDGNKVRVWYPGEEQREELSRHIAFLRVHREEVSRFLLARTVVPAMPRGVRLIAWNLKEPPIAIEHCSIVTDSALFARTTLEQLGRALAQRKWVGWGVPQLIDRLAQVGVLVALQDENLCDGKGDDAAASAGSAEAHPATYTSTTSPLPPRCSEGIKTSGVWGQSPR